MATTNKNGPTRGCIDCTNLKSDISRQLGAFKILSSINNSLSSTIIIQNIEELIAKHDQNKIETPSPPAPSPVQASLVVRHVPEIKLESHDPPPSLAMETTDEPALQSPAPLASPMKSSKAPKGRGRGKRKEKWEVKCLNLIENLNTQEYSLPFRNHVRSRDQLTFEKIQGNLQSRKYCEPMEFHKDMMLIFYNARLDNTDFHSPIRIMARKLESYYETCVEKENILEVNTQVNDLPLPRPTTTAEDSPLIQCRQCQERIHKKTLFLHKKRCQGQGSSLFKKKRRRQKKVLWAPRRQNSRPRKTVPKAKSNALPSEINLNPRKSNSKIPPKNLPKISEPRSCVPKKRERKVKEKVIKKKVGDEEIIVRNPFPKFNLKLALSAKVSLKRLHPKDILAARLKIKTSVPTYKPRKYGRITMKERKKALMKMDRISGLFNSRTKNYENSFLTLSKNFIDSITTKSSESTSCKNMNLPPVLSPANSKIVTPPSNPSTSSKNLKPPILFPAIVTPPKDMTSAGQSISPVGTPSPKNLAPSPQPAPVSPLEEKERDGAMNFNENSNDNSMLVISSAEAAAFGLNPFDEDGGGGQSHFEIPSPISEIVIPYATLNTEGVVEMAPNCVQESHDMLQVYSNEEPVDKNLSDHQPPGMPIEVAPLGQSELDKVQVKTGVNGNVKVKKESKRERKSLKDIWSKIRTVPKSEEDPTRRHKGPVTFECKICKKQFDYKHSAVNHVRRVHESKRVKCLDCVMNFTDIRGLWEHQAICKAFKARALKEAIRAKEEKEKAEPLAVLQNDDDEIDMEFV